MKHVHLVGIGGSGLSAIATVLLERGYIVSGSDRRDSPSIRRLRESGAIVFLGHRPENVMGADLLLRSSAIPNDNVEVQAAIAVGLPVLKRADFLHELTSNRQVIAVAGTHGKTTTTTMIAWVLTVLNMDPSYVIGGVSLNLGANAHAGSGKHFVIEADEYDHMFLGLQPQVAVVTSVEYDHPDCFPTPQVFHQAFRDFLKNLEPGGTLVACGDDPGARRLLSEVVDKVHQVATYGIGDIDCDYLARGITANEMSGVTFNLEYPGGVNTIPVVLRLPGEHNVRNALATLAVINVLGLPLEEAISALGAFQGTKRRFEVLGEIAGVTIIDDYAHHPTEIRATLAAARASFTDRRIWAVWQPHTYSRTRVLLPDFLSAFEGADRVVVTDVYAAREAAPSNDFSFLKELQSIPGTGNSETLDMCFIPGLVEAREFLLEHLKSGDVVIILSAGDANQIGSQLMQALPLRELAVTEEDLIQRRSEWRTKNA